MAQWGDDLAAKLLGSSVPAGFQECLAVWEVPIAPCPLITLADLKTALGIVDTTQDAELNRLINVYSQAIENYTERQMCETDREVVYIPRSTCHMRKMQVPQWPIITVTSLMIDGIEITDAEYAVNDLTGYIYPLRGDGWTINSYAHLEYSSGYAPIPADLQNVMISLCGSALNSGASTGDVGPLKSMRVEGAVTEQYYDARESTTSTASTSGAEDIGKFYSVLDYYRGERAFV